jgi:hypothetical protein
LQDFAVAAPMIAVPLAAAAPDFAAAAPMIAVPLAAAAPDFAAAAPMIAAPLAAAAPCEAAESPHPPESPTHLGWQTQATCRHDCAPGFEPSHHRSDYSG